MMKSEWCAKLCGSAACWLPENLLHNSKVSLYLHSFLYINRGAFSLFYHNTHFYFIYLKVTGKWCMRVTSWWTKFSTHFSKVSTHKIVLTYKSLSLYVFNKRNLLLRLFPGVEAAGWDMKRTLLDWDEWRVDWKTKSIWTVRRIQAFCIVYIIFVN